MNNLTLERDPVTEPRWPGPAPCDLAQGIADGLRSTAKNLRDSADALDRRASLLDKLSKGWK